MDQKRTPSDQRPVWEGEVGKLLHAIDWSKTAVGEFQNWPQSLKTSLSICLGSKFPMFVWWGKELTVFYNDAYIPLAGPLKHPKFLGRPASEQWAEIWEALRPLTEQVLEQGRSTWAESMLLYVTRKGFLEETYFTFSYSPIRDESGAVGGIINPCQETTERVLSARRLKTLHDLGAREVKNIQEVGQFAVNTLGLALHDIPFALIYLTSEDGKSANLISSAGIQTGTRAAVEKLEFSEQNDWPIARVFQNRKAERIDGLRSMFFPDLPSAPYEEKSDAAYLLPIEVPGIDFPAGVLILGISPRLEFDPSYQDFFELLCKQIATHVSSVRTLEGEKKRSEALADIDRVKTDFFNNVSHEFRTPLTLLLGPAEEALEDARDPLSPRNKERMMLIQRNALRLQKLVNSLLDFSRIEAGKMQVNCVWTDIAKFTAEIASAFETAMEKAGLEYRIECHKIDQEVFVDPDLWEKILLNLISNALKFTFSGRISVNLTHSDSGVLLQVIDTGTGIPEKELPHLFKRFHRVEAAQSRTHEGSGVGLALVQELVELHGGRISVQSHEGEGSTFTVQIPFGSAHLSQDRVKKGDSRLSPKPSSQFFECESGPVEPFLDSTVPQTKNGRTFRILLVDDNADMRNYIQRILVESGNDWEVLVAFNGQEALQLARTKSPDLILTDVMMPVMDGFGLLKAIRDDEKLRVIPVILLSARAGEEAKVEGLERGADDYLIKPFSSKELIARVSTQLELLFMRKEAAEQAQANHAKSQFLANMSHEIRTPLGAMLGFAELMLNPHASEDERRSCLKTIMRNGQHLTRVIDEILDLSKIESDRLEIENFDFSLTELIENVTTLLGLQAQEKGLILKVVYEGKIPASINSDPNRLKQILLNVVGNAMKFTSHGQVQLEVKALEEGRKIEFTITDTGLGMTPDQQEKLFQRFVQADNSMTRKYGGTGLGLVVSQKLARALGGDLILKQSNLTQGSTFVLVIQNQAVMAPLSRPVDFPKTREVQAQGRPLEGVKILLVDDFLDNRVLISRLLTLAGGKVITATDGNEGVKAALESECAVVLMDLQMPGKDGFEATSELRGLSFKKPIIAITAHTMKGDRERCLQNGFDDHIGKPVNAELLIATITKWIA